MADTQVMAGATTNGFTSRGQQQPMAGQGAVDVLTPSISKGGMRGIGIVAAAIAEYELKKKAVDLAKNYYNTNKIDYDFFTNVHQPAISSSATEVQSGLNPTYKYDTHTSALSGASKIDGTAKRWYEARTRMSKYNIGQQRRLDYDMAILRMHAIAAGWNAGTRYEMAWTDAHNERQFNRKAAVANVGISVGNIVRKGLAGAVSALSTSYDNLGDTVASIGNGFAEYAGNKDARAQVKQIINPKDKSNG